MENKKVKSWFNQEKWHIVNGVYIEFSEDVTEDEFFRILESREYANFVKKLEIVRKQKEKTKPETKWVWKYLVYLIGLFLAVAVAELVGVNREYIIGIGCLSLSALIGSFVAHCLGE